MRGGFLLGFALIGVAACGSDYGEETPPGASSSSSSTGGSSTSSGGAPPKTATPTPGKIECGTETCDVATQQCCAASASDLHCKEKTASCQGAATCDDAADCTDPAKPKCCGSSQGFSKSETRCVDKCDGINSAQSCRSDAECGSQQCIHQSCFGFTSWLCGLNPFCQKL